MAPKKSERKLCRTVEITEEQHERLRSLSERTRVPMAHYVREGIADQFSLPDAMEGA